MEDLQTKLRELKTLDKRIYYIIADMENANDISYWRTQFDMWARKITLYGQAITVTIPLPESSLQLVDQLRQTLNSEEFKRRLFDAMVYEIIEILKKVLRDTSDEDDN